MLLTDTQARLDVGPWNSLVGREIVQVIVSCVVSDRSWNFRENPFMCISMILLTNIDSEFVKSILDSRG